MESSVENLSNYKIVGLAIYNYKSTGKLSNLAKFIFLYWYDFYIFLKYNFELTNTQLIMEVKVDNNIILGIYS